MSTRLERLKMIKDWWRPDKISPELVKKFIDIYPIYRNDTNDPNFKPQKEIVEIQNKNLRRQIELCAKYSPYYKELFKKHNIDPSSIKTIDDLEKVPLTFKKDYMANPEAFKLAIDKPTFYELPWDVTFTTGTTTGVPTPFYNTVHDIYSISFFLIRSSKICWGSPDGIIFNAFPYGPVPHIGYLRAITSALAIGASVVSGHTGIPHPEFPIHRRMDEAIRMIETHKCNGIMGIASYVRRMIMRAEELGADFSSVMAIHVLGEGCPKGMRDDLRRRLEKLGAEDVFVHNGYGFTECQGSFSECTELAGNHNPSPDLYFIEIVDEETGERKADGETGLIAITHLNRRGTVLLRYVIGDIGRITHEPCPYCGRTGDRLLIVAGSTYATRTKELVKLKGTLINPAILSHEIENTRGVAEYQIVFTKEDPNDPYSMDKLVVRIAPSGEVPLEELREKIVDATFRAVEMRPEVEFTTPEKIFDTAVSLKAARIVDKRPQVV